ncbi:MAG: hypothetical protein R3B47_14160 [Bacteroidia bacterium]
MEVANIRSFIERLPLRYNTKIGNEGVGISTGQKAASADCTGGVQKPATAAV